MKQANKNTLIPWYNKFKEINVKKNRILDSEQTRENLSY